MTPRQDSPGAADATPGPNRTLGVAPAPNTVPSRTRHGSDVALIGFAGLVGAVTFTLSFHGLDSYGHHLAQLGRLSWLVPLGVDGLTLVAVAATYLLRRKPWRVRAYAWLVFFVAISASVAGNLSFAASEHLPVAGMVGAAAWPIFLALASHMVIVTRRSLEQHDTSDTAMTDVGVMSDETDTEPATEQPKHEGNQPPFDPRGYARRMAGRGVSLTDISRSLEIRGHKITPRTVGRWTEDVRTRANGSDSDLITSSTDIE